MTVSCIAGFSGLMDAERVPLHPELAFMAFVERLDAPERAVQMLINYKSGYNYPRAFQNHC